MERIKMKIRVSSGTAIRLGLSNSKALELPTTAYVMIPGGTCRGGCTFCPQARGDPKWLSRVSWPLYDMDELTQALEDPQLKRICIQSPDIPGYPDKITKTVRELAELDIPISLSAPPLSSTRLDGLSGSIDRVGIGIDAATDKLRDKVKTNYHPMVFWEYLGSALEILGEDRVTAHIIAGLGEDLLQLAISSSRAIDAGARVSLFSYRSNHGAPPLRRYRRAQCVVELIRRGERPARAVDIVLHDPGSLMDLIDLEKTFQTRGCPGCNRPYYTTRPGKEHRNYPRPPTPEELNHIKAQLNIS